MCMRRADAFVKTGMKDVGCKQSVDSSVLARPVLNDSSVYRVYELHILTTRCHSAVLSPVHIFTHPRLLPPSDQYVNVDDCWMAMNRTAEGKLTHDQTRFPSGMKALARYVHSKGLKFGLYTARCGKTCQGEYS